MPAEELHHFKQVVSRLPLANAASNNDVPDDGFREPEQGVLVEGVLDKLQRGTQGFAPVWKSRWVRILPGELQVFESAGRPEDKDTPCLFSLPLSIQQTRIDPGETSVQGVYIRHTAVVVMKRTIDGIEMETLSFFSPSKPKDICKHFYLWVRHQTADLLLSLMYSFFYI